MSWYFQVLSNYAVFEGRSRRMEYWMFTLVNFIIYLAIIWVIGAVIGTRAAGIIYVLYALAVLSPSIGVAIRRLHDTGRTGWWLWITLIPLIGSLVLLIFFVLDSEPGENQYGLNPK